MFDAEACTVVSMSRRWAGTRRLLIGIALEAEVQYVSARLTFSCDDLWLIQTSSIGLRYNLR